MPANAIGIIISKVTLEHCVHWDDPNTLLKPFEQCPHNAPDLWTYIACLNWRGWDVMSDTCSSQMGGLETQQMYVCGDRIIVSCSRYPTMYVLAAHWIVSLFKLHDVTTILKMESQE